MSHYTCKSCGQRYDVCDCSRLRDREDLRQSIAESTKDGGYGYMGPELRSNVSGLGTPNQQQHHETSGPPISSQSSELSLTISLPQRTIRLVGLRKGDSVRVELGENSRYHVSVVPG